MNGRRRYNMSYRIRILQRVRQLCERSHPGLEELKANVTKRLAANASKIPPIVLTRLGQELAPDSKLRIELSSDRKDLRGCYYPSDHRIVLWTHEPGVLLHELVHAIGGNELDSEVYERVLYPEEATLPDRKYDKLKFHGCDFVGRFARLSADGNIVYGKMILLGQEETSDFMSNVM